MFYLISCEFLLSPSVLSVSYLYRAELNLTSSSLTLDLGQEFCKFFIEHSIKFLHEIWEGKIISQYHQYID